MHPFERFTEDAKKVVRLAQEEAERSRHSYLGTEHDIRRQLDLTEEDWLRRLTD